MKKKDDSNFQLKIRYFCQFWRYLESFRFQTFAAQTLGII